MRERLFPRWCTALFALLPMSELLYLPADGQSVYAAALACTVCALAGIGAARLSDRVRHSAPAQWVLALTSLFPLLASIARMSIFLQKTVFTGRSCGSTVVLLTVCILLMASMGLNRCAMWALPIAWLAGTVLLLSGVLTFTQLTPASFSAPTAALLPQFRHILYSLLPASVVLAFLCRRPGCPQACRADSAQAVHCSHSCCCAQCCCLELTPLPCSPIRRSLPPDWLPSAILPDTARYSSQCLSSCVRLADAPHLSACCCIRSHAPAAFCTCADRNRIWATPHN